MITREPVNSQRTWPLFLSRDLERRPPAGGRAQVRQKGPLREGLCALALSAPALQEEAPQSARPVPRAVWASAGVGHRPRGAAGEAARLHFERATLTPSRGGGQHRSSAATTKLVGILVEACIKLHGCIGCGLNRSIRPLLDLTDGVLLGAGPRRLEKSRVKWRARGCLGRQVVVHGHSEQGCALVGLCLSMCEVGVRAGGVCG